MPNAKQLLEEFKENVDELVSKAKEDAASYDWGSHHQKYKLMVIGAYKRALSLTPGKSCHKCGGSGVVNTVSSVPYGSGNVSMNQTFVCDTLSDGTCCLCGGKLDSEFHICEECGEDWHRKLQ